MQNTKKEVRKMKGNRINIVNVLLLVSLVIVPAMAPAGAIAADLPKSVVIATMSKGSMSNILGSGLAKVIISHTPMTAVDRPYTGYQIWVPLTNKGAVDMSIGSLNSYTKAYRGVEGYKEKCVNLRIICGGNALMTGWVARPDSGINTVKDFKGRRIAHNPTSASIVARTFGLMRAAGVDPEKDVTLVPIAGVPKGLDAVMEGTVDAAWSAVGTAKNKELFAKFKGLRWVSVVESYDDPGGKWIRENSPGEDVALVKAGIVPEATHDFWFLKNINLLVSHQGFNEEAAYLITKAIWEKKDELRAIHPAFKTWHDNMIIEHGLLPYHPGSIRFYKEVGAWTEKLEKLQQKF